MVPLLNCNDDHLNSPGSDRLLMYLFAALTQPRSFGCGGWNFGPRGPLVAPTQNPWPGTISRLVTGQFGSFRRAASSRDTSESRLVT